MHRTKTLVFASHVACVNGSEYDGIGNVLKETLKSNSTEYIFVRHSMDGLLPSQIEEYNITGHMFNKVKLRVISNIAPLRYISEICTTVLYFMVHSKTDVFIGIDPLNALSGVILKKLGRVKKIVFYTADYSEKRFDNDMLNMIYHHIDMYCCRQSDEVWNVSKRIWQLRKKMGVSNKRNIFVPNVPPVSNSNDTATRHNKFELITTGIIDKQLDFEGTIRAVALLKNEIPELVLTIVGNGPEEGHLKKLAKELGVSGKVTFTGRLSLLESLRLQSGAGMGLALYTGIWGFNTYGDSTKCREYFRFGLPVISTDTHSTVEDIVRWDAGMVVDKNVDAYVRAIKEILNRYEFYSSNSTKAGWVYENIHLRLIRQLLKTENKPHPVKTSQSIL